MSQPEFKSAFQEPEKIFRVKDPWGQTVFLTVTELKNYLAARMTQKTQLSPHRLSGEIPTRPGKNIPD